MSRINIFILAVMATFGAGFGLIYAETRGSSSDTARPLPEFALAGSDDMEKAFEGLLSAANMQRTGLPTPPDSAALWVVALEPGPGGSRQQGASVVLDYYSSEHAVPKELSDLAGYRGLRIQVIYRGLPGGPGSESTLLSASTDREIRVVGGDTGASYYVSRDGQTVEVRVWSTGGGLPSVDALIPLLETV